MENISNEKLKEILALLEGAGMKPMLCDCPVQYYDVDVHAGMPTGIGEPERGEYMMLPRELVGLHPVFVIHVTGDSMKDADLNEGDQVSLEVCDQFNDGDIVVASINGEYTIKTYFVDAEGNHWLVPQNKDYAPIRLTEDMNIRFFGRVVNVIKAPRRPSYRELAKVVNKAMNGQASANTEERVERTIRLVADKVQTVRQWFAVYKGLVSKRAFPNGEYEEFALLVRRTVPGHKHMADARELRRMEELSFRKSPVLWDEKNAPVTGKRFEDYLRIATLTMEEVEK